MAKELAWKASKAISPAGSSPVSSASIGQRVDTIVLTLFLYVIIILTNQIYMSTMRRLSFLFLHITLNSVRRIKYETVCYWNND